MEMKYILKLLIKISYNLREHKCDFKNMNSDECRDCMLADEIDFVIWNLRGRS